MIKIYRENIYSFVFIFTWHLFPLKGSLKTNSVKRHII